MERVPWLGTLTIGGTSACLGSAGAGVIGPSADHDVPSTVVTGAISPAKL